MPLDPGGSEQGASDASVAAGSPPPFPAITLGRRLRRILFGLFALELGLFLCIYPWSEYWNLNHLPAILFRYLPGGELANASYPNFDDFWDDPVFRSAVTFLGALDLWIASRAISSAFRRINS